VFLEIPKLEFYQIFPRWGKTKKNKGAFPGKKKNFFDKGGLFFSKKKNFFLFASYFLVFFSPFFSLIIFN